MCVCLLGLVHIRSVFLKEVISNAVIYFHYIKTCQGTIGFFSRYLIRRRRKTPSAGSYLHQKAHLLGVSVKEFTYPSNIQQFRWIALVWIYCEVLRTPIITIEIINTTRQVEAVGWNKDMANMVLTLRGGGRGRRATTMEMNTLPLVVVTRVAC